MARKSKSRAVLEAPLSDALRSAIDKAQTNGLTQNRLAVNAGVSPIAVGRFMRQERGLSLETADRLARVLGLALVQAQEPNLKE